MYFPTWFAGSVYGGLAWCLLLVILNICLTVRRRRRAVSSPLVRVMIACCLSVMLLLCALIWNYLHLLIQHGRLTSKAVWTTWGIWGGQAGWFVLAVTLLSWVLPLWVTCVHWLRLTAGVVQMDADAQALPAATARKSGKSGKLPVPATVQPPHYQPGEPVPLVFKDDTPWGWLEYSNGNFQGQRLALKRTVITIGRDENCDIWLDDDLVSRYHAELAWCQQQVCLTDCNSLNGVLLNGHPVQGIMQVQTSDAIQVGVQKFVFALAEQKEAAIDDQYDPLAHHTWRSMNDFQVDTSSPLPAASYRADVETSAEIGNNASSAAGAPAPVPAAEALPRSPRRVLETDHELFSPASSSGTGNDKLSPIPAIDDADAKTALIVRSGTLAGQCLWLDQPMLVIGCSAECNLVLHDDSLVAVQAQIYHQPYGDYIQALTSESEVSVNNVMVQGAQLLRAGDMLRLGKVLCEYLVPDASDSGMLPSPRYAKSLSGPVPLRLPSRKL